MYKYYLWGRVTWALLVTISCIAWRPRHSCSHSERKIGNFIFDFRYTEVSY